MYEVLTSRISELKEILFHQKNMPHTAYKVRQLENLLEVNMNLYAYLYDDGAVFIRPVQPITMELQ